jgi:hypothetical protein
MGIFEIIAILWMTYEVARSAAGNLCGFAEVVIFDQVMGPLI